MLTLDEIFTYIDEHFHRSAWRLEALDVYDVESDGDDVARYLAGQDRPTNTTQGPWLEQLRNDTAAGKSWSRVHVFRGPLSDYLRYECEWGYVYNVAAGEDVRILDLTERDEPAGLLNEEFWLYDDRYVLVMKYDDAGHFLGGIPVEDESQLPKYLAARDAAVAAAEPFTDWWERHPQYHRNAQMA